jgi:hypothetical protein
LGIVVWFLRLSARAAVTAFQRHNDNFWRLGTMPLKRAFRADDDRLVTAKSTCGGTICHRETGAFDKLKAWGCLRRSRRFVGGSRQSSSYNTGKIFLIRRRIDRFRHPLCMLRADVSATSFRTGGSKGLNHVQTPPKSRRFRAAFFGISESPQRTYRRPIRSALSETTVKSQHFKQPSGQKCSAQNLVELLRLIAASAASESATIRRDAHDAGHLGLPRFRYSCWSGEWASTLSV